MDIKEFFSLVVKRAARLSCSSERDISILALEAHSEGYAFLYDDESRAELKQLLGRFASSHDLSFTWYDAAVLAQKVRQEEQQEVKHDDF